MRNAFMILPAAMLMTGAVMAQESTGSVDDILKSLTDYQTTKQAAAAPKAAVKAKPVAKAKPAKAKPVVKAAPVAEAEPVAVVAPVVAEEADVDAMLQETREQMLGGEFIEAQAGLAELIKIAPENKMAQLYRRTLMERDYRNTEISAIDAVDAAWSTDLVLRSYTLADGADERMGLEDATGAIDVDTLFPQVEFPADSSALYQPDTQTIYIRNTQANLAVLETMLETMSVLKDSESGEQVEIEAKFVEISEGTLEALGFQWDYEGTVAKSVLGTSMSVYDGDGLFSDALRGSPNGSSELPFDQSENLVGAGDGNWTSARFEDTFSSSADFIELNSGGTDGYDLLISALDQSSGSDVLSAPRIVTLSGEEATIRVGERHFYPEVFEGESDAATMLVVSYQDFTEKLLGVELAVTPEVMDDQIRLTLNPRITELAGWREYQLAPESSIYNHRQDDVSAKYEHDAVTAQLPIFKKREIETDVTIADGSTIGMGGLMSETIESYVDKVPVMGNLPLVGRLFRNEGERVVKRNLLMFVTAKIVEPNGRVSTTRSFE